MGLTEEQAETEKGDHALTGRGSKEHPRHSDQPVVSGVWPNSKKTTSTVRQQIKKEKV